MPLPDGRTWGSTAGVDAAKGRDDIWAIDRCGSNTCVGSHANPLLHYDADGNLIGQMGADLFAFPHGIHVDQEGNVWVTDPLPPDGRGAGGDVGQQVTKLSPTGEILLQLGHAQSGGRRPEPVQLAVRRRRRQERRHLRRRRSRRRHDRAHHEVRQGRQVHQVVGQVRQRRRAARASSRACTRSPIDSRGRLFIGDRDNNRIQIYDQDGNYLDCWYQFSRPSGIFIDADDNLFVTDSESRDGANDGKDLAHPGLATRHPDRQRARRLGAGTSFRIPIRKAAAAPPRASRRSKAARSSTAPRWARGRSFATTDSNRSRSAHRRCAVVGSSRGPAVTPYAAW